jgi:hypothetical protein
MIRFIRPILLLIGGLTIVSGLYQLFAPASVLQLVQGESTPTSRHFFAIIGMFMFLFGGLTVHALYSPASNKAAILWAALQKGGASAAVLLGIQRHLLAGMALPVSLFDGLSFLLLLYYYLSIDKLNPIK